MKGLTKYIMAGLVYRKDYERDIHNTKAGLILNMVYFEKEIGYVASWKMRRLDLCEKLNIS